MRQFGIDARLSGVRLKPVITSKLDNSGSNGLEQKVWRIRLQILQARMEYLFFSVCLYFLLFITFFLVVLLLLLLHEYQQSAVTPVKPGRNYPGENSSYFLFLRNFIKNIVHFRNSFLTRKLTSNWIVLFDEQHPKGFLRAVRLHILKFVIF